MIWSGGGEAAWDGQGTVKERWAGRNRGKAEDGRQICPGWATAELPILKTDDAWAMHGLRLTALACVACWALVLCTQGAVGSAV